MTGMLVRPKARGDVIRAISNGIKEAHTVTIKVDGDSGRLSIKVGKEVVATYTDVYEAVSVLLPAEMELLK